MTTCRYCGQVLPPGEESVASSRRDRRPSSGGASPSGEPRVLDDGDPEPRTTIAVDEALLTLCNRAHAQADQNGCQMVEIAHLVMIMTSAHLADREFECEGLSRRDVAMAAERTLASAARGTPPSKPRTSPELRVLLVRAERLARADAREFTSAQDFLRALAQQSGDLVSARFVPDALLYHRRAEHSAALPERHPVRREWREPRQQRFDFQTGGAEPTNRSAELPTVRDVLGEPDAGSLGMRTLIERVERQEHLLSGLTALVARVLEPKNVAQHQGAAASEGPDERATPDRLTGSMPGTSAHSSRDSRTRQRWRRRTVVVGSADGQAKTVRAAQRAPVEGSRDGLLRLVTRAAGEASISRLKSSRASSPDHDALSQLVEFDASDDGDGQSDRMKRFYLSPGDDIVRAPSIGPRTAARLIPAGLVLVRDLLVCDPADVAVRVDARYITASRIADWKAQARLVCTIPWLRGAHAQLLVGAGYDTIGKLQRADAASVCAAILRFASTREGQSILRSGPPPEIDRIACWIENTALAEPARAA